ncbi:LOW QUALITY PROTEIN: hypothetical protein MAR_030727, partial [Mya arenaria]
RKDRSPYPPSTLYNLTNSIQRTLREESRLLGVKNVLCKAYVHGRPDINMLDKGDSTFMEFRKQQLDSRMKELTNRGVGIHRVRADPVTTKDENQMWENSVIGFNCAKSLSRGVFCFTSVFGFRGGAEHRNLQVEQYLLSVEPGNRILTFQACVRLFKGDLINEKLKQRFQDSLKCPLIRGVLLNILLNTYLENVPPTGPFYWKQLPGTATVSIAFSSQVVGGNTLGTFIKSMFQEAGISTKCRNIRNHSGKVTLFIRLYKDSFDEQAIMSRSGHRSTAVRDYKRTSTALRRSLIDRLQPPMAPITTATAALATYLCEPTDVVSMPLSATTMSTLFATMKSGQKNAMRNIKTETSCQKTEQNAIEICMPEI